MILVEREHSADYKIIIPIIENCHIKDFPLIRAEKQCLKQAIIPLLELIEDKHLLSDNNSVTIGNLRVEHTINSPKHDLRISWSVPTNEMEHRSIKTIIEIKLGSQKRISIGKITHSYKLDLQCLHEETLHRSERIQAIIEAERNIAEIFNKSEGDQTVDLFPESVR